jgi:uncharacterized protein (DUF927 family)
MKKTRVTPKAILVDEISRKHQLLLNIRPKIDDSFNVSVDMADVRKTQCMIDVLTNYGVTLPSGKDQALKWLNDNVVEKIEKLPTRSLVQKTGWTKHNQFVLNRQTFGKADPHAWHVDRLKASEANENPQKPSLEDWVSGLASVTKHSRVTVACLALAFSGPLLRSLSGRSGLPLFNLKGESSCGKTSTLMLATTAFGGVQTAEDLMNFDHTPRALEESLDGSNDLFQAIDEEGTADNTAPNRESAHKRFALIVSGGSGKKLSKVVSGESGKNQSSAVNPLLPQMKWKCAVLTTSNVAVSNALGKATTNSPTAVRWIELQIKNSDKGGFLTSQIALLARKSESTYCR